MPTPISRLWKFNTDDTTTTWFFTGTWVYRGTGNMDVKFVALKTVVSFYCQDGKLMQFISVLHLVCVFLWSFDFRLHFYVAMLHLVPFIESNKNPITNHQHCRAKLRARCLRSSWNVLPIDGSVNTVACRGHIMAASDSHHSGPVSYKS
jgi:hypothetical protein